MPEFKEYEKDNFDNDSKQDNGKKKKKKIKNKWFFIGLAVVLIVVIIQKIRQAGSSSEEETTSGYYETPLGYSGYPSTGSSSGDASYVDDALNTMAGEFNSVIEEIYTENETNIKNLESEWSGQVKSYETIIDEMSAQIDAFGDKYDKVVETVDKQAETINYQNIITMMKENSDKALITNSQAEKDYLHRLNEQYADQIGATFNDKDGYWYMNGKRLYSTALQSSRAETGAVASAPVTSAPATYSAPTTPTYSAPTVYPSTGTGSSSSSSNVSGEDRNKLMFMMMNNSSRYRNATDSEKVGYYEQNQKIGKILGLNYDDASGKWKNSDGSDAWDYNVTHSDGTVFNQTLQVPTAPDNVSWDDYINSFDTSTNKPSSSKSTSTSKATSTVKKTVKSAGTSSSTSKASTTTDGKVTTSSTGTKTNNSTGKSYPAGTPEWIVRANY